MTSPLVVDLNALPHRADVGDGFDYPAFAKDVLDEAIPTWQRKGLIKDPGNGSWGGFLANIQYAGRYYAAPFDDPYSFIGTVFGDGPEQLGYGLNAARKGLLLAGMTHQHGSTLAIKNAYTRFQLGESAGSAVSAGDLRWMQFNHGGAVVVGEGPKQRLWGISAFDEIEDDALIRLLAVLAETTQGRLA